MPLGAASRLSQATAATSQSLAMLSLNKSPKSAQSRSGGDLEDHLGSHPSPGHHQQSIKGVFKKQCTLMNTQLQPFSSFSTAESAVRTAVSVFSSFKYGGCLVQLWLWLSKVEEDSKGGRRGGRSRRKLEGFLQPLLGGLVTASCTGSIALAGCALAYPV